MPFLDEDASSPGIDYSNDEFRMDHQGNLDDIQGIFIYDPVLVRIPPPQYPAPAGIPKKMKGYQ